MANGNCGLDELLDLLKKKPGLIKELIFNPETIRELLGTDEARKLALGQDPQTFLNYVAGPDDGYPIGQCLQKTTIICAKGTRFVACYGGTRQTNL